MVVVRSSSKSSWNLNAVPVSEAHEQLIAEAFHNCSSITSALPPAKIHPAKITKIKQAQTREDTIIHDTVI